MKPSLPADEVDLRLDHVSKSYLKYAAVRDLNLSVKKGEFLTLLGASGCGKTTTLRLIAGFEKPDSGVIEITGRPVTALPPHKRNVNTVFQNYALFPHLSLFENVAFGLRLSGVREPDLSRRVHNALERMRLNVPEDRRPHELSGGQQQRVALARALVNNPTILLLDEPLGALDLQLRRQVQHELKDLQRSLGITFIYVTHDQEEAQVLSDRIAVMAEGKIQQIGSPGEIYNSPINRVVASFIGTANFFMGRVATIIDGRAAVDIPHLGIIQGLVNNGISVGNSVVMCIRPEKIRVAQAVTKNPHTNFSKGILADVSRLGSDIQMFIKLANGQRIRVDQRLGSGRSPPLVELGAKLLLSWSEEDVIVFPNLNS
ncbi:MAG: ABC transporter ATP-binding protein [Taibaiella sp.]|nr:ABC transporter ATP-binding protein [Taibaiella sp.]